ncbi:MAG: RNA pyrophosphohydrolase [Pseudomonadota bacterium]|nr:RNA pyrophosphohydrolase [Pseudomonadota bacterium]
MTEPAVDERPFRPCVGIFLINSDGKIFVGARNDLPGDHWQMPQGGIDEGETPEVAAFREMEEEIGTAKAEIISAYENWIYYRLPPELSKTAWKGRFQGQKQKWFALRYLGTDGDINIETEYPEFRAWKWADLEELPEMTVDFKQPAYEEIRAAFRNVVNRIKTRAL